MAKHIESASLDKEWYKKFQEIGVFDAYMYLDGNDSYRLEQQRKFEAGEIENPTLDYPKLNLSELEAKEVALGELRDHISATSLPNTSQSKDIELVKEIYYGKIEERLSEIRMLKAAATADMPQFKEHSIAAYGSPSFETYSYILKLLYEELEKLRENTNQALANAANQLIDTLSVRPSDNSFDHIIDQQTFEAVSERTLQEFEDFLPSLSTESELDASSIKQAFEETLAHIPGNEWKITIDPNRKRISVSLENKLVIIPESRRMAAHELAGYILHEVCTHVLRANNGERSRVLLLAFGLKGYLRGEEGIAMLRQQVGERKLEQIVHADRHLAVSLALGLDGQPRDFRRLYEIMYSYYHVKELASGNKLVDADEKARIRAWHRCIDTFRGTDCRTSGVCYTKDASYTEGYIAIWKLVKKNITSMQYFNIGKFDPANEQHLHALIQLDIIHEATS